MTDTRKPPVVKTVLSPSGDIIVPGDDDPMDSLLDYDSLEWR